MFGTKIAPNVLVGLVLFLGTATITDLLAEGQETKPGTAPKPDEGGKVVGILTHFEYNWTKVKSPKQPDTRLSLKAEGEKEAVNYVLALPNKAVDPKLEVALRKVFPSNTVSMEWELRDGKKLVTKIAVLTPTSGQGVKRGTVIALNAGSVDLKGEDRGDRTVRYVVPWDAKAKGPNPGLVKALQGLNVGDRVAITWIANPERLWVSQVKILPSAPAK